MRFIGNKENLVERIYQVMESRNISGNSFFDFFSGTSNVGKYFKKLNYQIYSSDLMYFSYVLQRAYIQNNQKILFRRLLNSLNYKSDSLFSTPLELVVEFLNNLEGKEGFIYQNYTPAGTKELESPRKYFSNENGKIIDAIRQKIEEWKYINLIDEDEYFVLLACLIETVSFYANIAGVYAAFHKNWDPRSIKKLKLRSVEIIINKKNNYSFNIDSTNLLENVVADIFYLDPPYNQRQYAPNYHLLETIAKYDNPEIYGIAGLREYKNQKSLFCNPRTAIQELTKIAKNGKYKSLILSYNSEGIMTSNDIISTLENFGKVELVEFEYLRFKSNSKGLNTNKKYVNEQLYILRKNEK